MYKLNVTFLFTLLFNSTLVSGIDIPLKDKVLSISISDKYKVETKCKSLRNIICYEISNEDTIFSLYITDLSNNSDFEGSLKKICKTKVKKNKNNLEYCWSNNTYLLTKNKQLINVSSRGKDIKSLLHIVNEMK
jgi:hypothetical protein